MDPGGSVASVCRLARPVRDGVLHRNRGHEEYVLEGVRRVGDLEIGQGLDFQRREWAIQRIDWMAMLLVLAAVLLGLFGRGVFGSVTASESDGSLHFAYDRFDRKHSPTKRRVEVADLRE